MSVSVAIILDTRREKKTKKYPVKLRVTQDRKTEYYPTIYDLFYDDYKKFTAPHISSELQEVRKTLKQIETDAENLVTDLEPFSFETFEKDFIYNNPLFRQKKHIKKALAKLPADDKFDYTPFYKKFPILKDADPEPDTIGFTYLTYIKQLLKEGRIGSATAYQCSYRSLKSYGGNVRFTTITADYLRDYERWVKSNGNSKTTVGIYIRSLRTMFNEAHAAGIIKKEKCYPFGRKKYLIPSKKNVKKALKLDQIEMIYNYTPTCESEWKARDYWLFIYFGNGMNTKDMALLKYSNITGEFIIFERAKTELTTRDDPKPISVYINEEMREIIERWGNKDKGGDNYIFPVLAPGLSALREYELIQLFTAFINEWLEKIRLSLGFERKVRTMEARHSFSTVLKRSGVSTEFIQESLGHTDIRTTENYLDSFENEIKKEFSAKLAPFKKEQKQSKPIIHEIPADKQKPDLLQSCCECTMSGSTLIEWMQSAKL
ncbi:MAG: site-specific integrase [Niabella sp.]